MTIYNLYLLCCSNISLFLFLLDQINKGDINLQIDTEISLDWTSLIELLLRVTLSHE